MLEKLFEEATPLNKEIYVKRLVVYLHEATCHLIGEKDVTVENIEIS